MPPRRRRPPWWPEDEAWPPTRRPWQVNRRAALVRLFFGIIVAIVVIGILSNVAWHAFGRVPDNAGENGPGRWFIFPIVFWLIVIGSVVFLVRRIGRGVRPMFDLIDASTRVSNGDYTVRVQSSGNQQLQNLIDAFNSMTQKLEITEQQRRRLLADIAHELRTPLAVIQGSVEGMIDGVYPRDDAHLEPLLRESHLIARLLDDLSVLSRAEAGELELFREATDLRELLVDVVSAFSHRATSTGVDLHLRPGEALPELDLDPMRIRQVVENLVANALRHTPECGIVEISAVAISDQVELVIRDTGSGIPAELVTFIFDRFVKSADSGGSGLGLAIARRLIETHGGTIEAVSEVGVGTEMQIRLPIGSASTT